MRRALPGSHLAVAVALAAVPLAGCANFQRLGEVGSPPPLSPITDPTQDPRWRPVSMPTPASDFAVAEAGSLWRPGARAFFKDQRAMQVGDLITVVVNTAGDSAVLSNASTATRTGNEAAGAPDIFGAQTAVSRRLGGIDLSKLVGVTSANAAVGNAKITRGEAVQIRVGGVITQVLPNGNLVMAGRQEIRVNSELRELRISGIVRPQDIQSDNTVLHDRVAEARISYGGRGQLTDVQTPRYGQQIIDILSPF